MKDNRENHTVLTAVLIAIVIVLPLPCGHRRVRDSPIDRSSLNTIAQRLGEACYGNRPIAGIILSTVYYYSICCPQYFVYSVTPTVSCLQYLVYSTLSIEYLV